MEFPSPRTSWNSSLHGFWIDSSSQTTSKRSGRGDSLCRRSAALQVPSRQRSWAWRQFASTSTLADHVSKRKPNSVVSELYSLCLIFCNVSAVTGLFTSFLHISTLSFTFFHFLSLFAFTFLILHFLSPSSTLLHQFPNPVFGENRCWCSWPAWGVAHQGAHVWTSLPQYRFLQIILFILYVPFFGLKRRNESTRLNCYSAASALSVEHLILSWRTAWGGLYSIQGMVWVVDVARRGFPLWLPIRVALELGCWYGPFWDRTHYHKWRVL